MTNNSHFLDEIGNKNPFTTPEGYFDGLTERIMSQLPERHTETPKIISLWDRVKPWIYMAAMFAGIFLMVNLFTHLQSPSGKSGLNLSSSDEIDDFYQYYEDQMATTAYHETFYVDLD
ncbi:MAG: hypothetical protein LBG77_03555 [Dysgonamonadaceae bacterium]|jgi:hypothetical protein|nr:hypothetical protein [Dysgonamonadaceae bacterium]